MVSLEQVKLLETKVTRTIEYVKKVTDENTQLKGKLDSYQKKIDELEVLIQRFRDDQSQIEDGILSALDRLNQFEDALESTLSAESRNSSDTRAAPKKDTREGKKAPAEEPRRANNAPAGPAPAAPADDTSISEPALPLNEEKNPEQARGELDIF